MSAAPDHLAFYHPDEDGPRGITLISEYMEDTIPNDPVTVEDEAASIVVKHVTEFIADDTGSPGVRASCLEADLGYEIDRPGFYELIDTYQDPMTPDQAEDWKNQLHDFLSDYTEERP